MLINDINRHNGYPQPVNSRRGINLPARHPEGRHRTWTPGTPYGTISVPWTDFAPQALLAVAAYYADATTQPSQAADRRWLAANFALENGQPSDAKALAARAAQDQPDYAKELGAVFRGNRDGRAAVAGGAVKDRRGFAVAAVCLAPGAYPPPPEDLC